MLDYILKMLADVTYYLRTTVADLAGALGGMVRSVSSWIYDLVKGVGGALSSLTSQITQTVLQITSGVLAQLQQILNPILDAVLGIVVEVKAFFQQILNQLREVVVNLWTAVTKAIGTAIDSITRMVRDAAAALRAIVETSVNAISGLVRGISSQVAGMISAAIGAVRDVAQAIVSVAVNGINGMILAARQAIAQTINLINEGWKNLVTGATSLVKSIDSRLQDVRKGMADIAEELAKSLGGLSEEAGKNLKLGAESIADRFVSLFGEDDVRREQTELRAVVNTITNTQADRAAFMGLWQKLTPQTTFGRALHFSLFSLAWGWSVYSGIGAEMGEVITQEWRAQYTPTILSAPDIVGAWRHGELTEEEALTLLKRHGYPTNNGRRMLQSSEGAPTPFELVSMKRRGLIGADSLAAGMRAAGLGREWEEAYFKLTEYIPPPADLVHMAVREAFSPDIATKFGQYEDFPEDFAKYAEQQGLSAEWARRYWAAHWSLPSPQMGFEMLHRRVKTRDGGEFNESDLDMLLRAQDVMPFWRTPLVEIAYRPYTRVDVRRMHKVGVLSDNDLPKAYADLGYDADHAANLAEFTKRVNESKEQDSADELGRLTRSSILTFYKDGLLTADRAQALLVEIGVTPQAATLYIQGADLSEEAQQRAAEATLIVDQALAGMLSRVQAEDGLRRLGLTDVEVVRAVNRIMRAEQARVKLPTRAEGEAMLLAGIITGQAYEDLLKRLGYADSWVAAYMSFARVKVERREARES